MARQVSKGGNDQRADRLRNALRDNLARRKQGRPDSLDKGEAGETVRRKDRLEPRLIRREDPGPGKP
ncbi:MAG: hypothetical protein KDJ48_03355 [Nitratireductor sp.]|nr:hypothetical protein [Nitratireductor sp.]MCB1458299.1 hypothetical protein [Nitratireductor sp.]